MAIKNLLPLTFVFCAITVQAQKLEPRSDCIYHSESTVLNNKTVITKQTEKCVEEPGVDVPQLKIGDVVRSNQLLKHPVIDKNFNYKQTKCRWFVQAHSVQKDLVQYQGIACEVQPNVWQVIDKF